MLKNMIPYKKQTNLNLIEISSNNSVKNVLIREISLEGPGNKPILSYVVRPVADGKYPGVIFLHWLEPHAENSNKTEFLSLAITLAEKNIASILPDCFWSTTPEKYKKNPKIDWTTEYENDAKLIKNQLIELLMAIDFFESLSFIDQNNLVFCGHDFGAMFGILLSSFKSYLKAYILMAPTSKFSDWFRFGNAISTLEEFQDYVEKMAVFDPVTNIKDIKSSILFQFALNDFYVPVEKALELIHKTSSNFQTKWYKTNHSLNESVFEDAKSFILEKLGR